MPISENKLDEFLSGLRANHPPQTLGMDDGLQNNVWLRVGEMTRSRVTRQKNLLATAIFVTALGAGFGTAEQPAMASTQTDTLIGGTDYSPANLLHVSK